jgi:hypothetical protein
LGLDHSASPPRADFTVADVLAWARTKPASETYDYCDNDNCALAQFLRETGRAKRARVNPLFWRDGVNSKRTHPIPHGLNDAALEGGETFGGFVEQLEQLVSA